MIIFGFSHQTNLKIDNPGKKWVCWLACSTQQDHIEFIVTRLYSLEVQINLLSLTRYFFSWLVVCITICTDIKYFSNNISIDDDLYLVLNAVMVSCLCRPQNCLDIIHKMAFCGKEFMVILPSSTLACFSETVNFWKHGALLLKYFMIW